MAYQPKSYRKFVATAATATLVATAVTPAFAAGFTDVSDRYKEAVDYLVNEKITQGMSETKFGVDEQIKRVDAAVMIANALKLDTTKAPNAGFTDVPERAQGAVNALKAAGIINGKTDTKFGSADQLTRGEMALILQKAYKLTGSADHKFTDVSDRYDAAVKALVANNITQGKSETKFGTTDAIKRGEFAIFMYKINKPVVAPTVEDVKATGAKTLEVTGKDLQNLKAENLTVAGNTVTAVSANADGTKATVSLANNLVPNEETTVKTTINEQSKEFKFTFKYVIESVAVENATFDDDTKGQKVTLLANNEKADLNYLAANGYSVEYRAYDEKGNDATETFFKNVDATDKVSKDGELEDTVEEGKYHVQAVVSKGSTILTSEKASITVVNLDSAASAISSYELTNDTLGAAQKSTTLVVDEAAKFTKLHVAAGSEKTEVTSGYTVSSSNPGVVSVKEDPAGSFTLKAEAPGKAKITLTFGKLTKEVELTVSGKARKVAKVQPETSSVKLLTGTDGERDVKVKVTDQYGDPVKAVTETIDEVSHTLLDDTSDITTDAKGEGVVKLTPGSKEGNGTVCFKDADGNFLGSLGFQITKVNNVAKQVLEVKKVADQSEDLTLDINDAEDNTVTLKVANYTSENVYNGDQDLTNYTPKFNDKIVNVAMGPKEITVSAVKAGTSDIAIYNDKGVFVGKVTVTVTVTVTDKTPEITKVNWLTPGTINYKGELINFADVLETTESANDDIVKGITLSTSTLSKVRIA
ncbi:S-layer homology domain-containing protein, partial [Pseudobacillus badius]